MATPAVDASNTMTTPAASSAAGRHGLANLGNTCYLNSAIQALHRTGVFTDFLGTDAWTTHKHPERKSHPMTEEMADLMHAMNSPGGQIIIPAKFVHAFVDYAKDFNDDIALGSQADTAEAVQILLDGIHMALAREVRMEITGKPANPEHEEIIRSHESWMGFFRKEYSTIIENFYGQTQIRIICGACSASSTRYEPWSVLKLPIPGADKAGAPAPNLQECIEAYMEPEKLDDYTCEKCKVRGLATIEHAISRYPKYLIVSLKRFTNTGAKVRARIPYDADAIDFAAHRAFPTYISPSAAHYRVISTVEHLGGSRGGHYCMRSRSRDVEEDGRWYILDDTRVGFADTGGAAGPDTYMLVLERNTA